MSREHLHPALRAALAGRRTDIRVRLHWTAVDGSTAGGVTDTVGSLTLLVTGAVQEVTGARPVIVGVGEHPLPLFRDAAAATDYLLRRAVDPGPGGVACRSALHYLATRDTVAERVAATPVGATVALF